MAKTFVTTTTDDLDGTSNAETVSFSLDGRNYEMDLGKRNRVKLEKSLQPYIAVARKVPKRGKGSTGLGRKSSASNELTEIRAWAQADGRKIATRGRISADVMEAYHKAMG
jgi:hypothetical protein